MFDTENASSLDVPSASGRTGGYRDGSISSSAGVTTRIDLALALIEQDLGREAAQKAARVLVVYLKRAAGQSQYSALLASQTESTNDAFAELEGWIAEHLTADLRVEALAARVHMSPRNFARVYSQKRGRTPAKAVEAIRVDTARRLLEESDRRIAQVAEVCGFRNEEHLRSVFVRNLGIPPREYRKRSRNAGVSAALCFRPLQSAESAKMGSVLGHVQPGRRSSLTG